MGKRLIITVESLLRGNCMLMQKIKHRDADPAGQFEAWNEMLLHVTFPNRVQWYFDFCVDGEKMWASCDYNDWGSAYATIGPLLAKYNIAHMVV